MATLQETLVRLRRYRRAVTDGDPKLAEEICDRGTEEEVYSAPLSATALEAEIDQESIALRVGRPVLAIRENVTDLTFIDEAEGQTWRDRLKRAGPLLAKAIPSVGRINLHGGDVDWIGTGWLVAESTIVTNRHVADRFAEGRGSGFVFKMGFADRISADVDFLQEVGREEELVFKFKRPLHIEPSSGPDVAFFEIEMISGSAKLAQPIVLASKIVDKTDVATIGYPAYDSRIPEPELMKRIYGDVYNKKRLAPGNINGVEAVRLLHNCTTLGGNSGSVVVDLDSGAAVGLHFSGSFLKTNYAVRGDVVKRLLDGLQSRRPPMQSETARRPQITAPMGGSVPVVPSVRGSTISIPLTLRVTVNLDLAGAAAVARPAVSAGAGVQDVQDHDEGEEVAVADYADRKGYDETFLGDDNAVVLPQVVRNSRDVLEFNNDGKTDTVLRYEHFSVVMSRGRRMCYFSGCNIDGDTSKKNVRGLWKWDPRIPKEFQIMKECYGTPPKFSRGHMTRREDPGWGSKAEAKRGCDDSMHVTNTTPQMQAFNSPIWLALEDYALQHARQDTMRISVFTGPYFKRSDPVMYGVKIPLSFWKVIAFIHDESRELCATGYVMNQKSTLQPEEEYVYGAFRSPQLGTATQVPISRIERDNGLSFGRLAEVDPLAAGEEGASEDETSIELLAIEQIRFLP